MAKALPPAVQASMSKLTPAMQKAFRKDYNRRRRSRILIFLAWLLLGWHYLYVGKTGWQIVFWLTLGGVGVWWLIDLFRIGKMAAIANEDIARELMTQYRIMS